MTDNFIETHRRMRDVLQAQLKTRPVVEIIGIVSASGVSGNETPPSTTWNVVIPLAAWRINNEPLKPVALRLEYEVANQDAVDGWMQMIQPDTIIKVRARVVEDGPLGIAHGSIEELLEKNASDTALEAHLEELKKPRHLHDDKLGTFTFDRSVDCYKATIQWNGNFIQLWLEETTNLPIAHALWNEATRWHQRVVEYALQELLPLKNQIWLDDDEEELTAEVFTQRMKLETITVNYDGSFAFWHHDGDLFWGHSILVSGTLAKGPTSATIAG